MFACLGGVELYHDEKGYCGGTWTCTKTSIFEPPIQGNILGGGDEYIAKDCVIPFEIEDFNVFLVDIKQ